MPFPHSALFLFVLATAPVAGDGWLGVTLEDSSEQPKIAEVIPDSPAERAGLRPGDVFMAIDGEAIADVEALVEAIQAHDAGDRVRLRIRRGADAIDDALDETRRDEVVRSSHLHFRLRMRRQ